MKLGLKPFVHDRRDLQFAKYRVGSLPPHPATFGHEGLVASWGMLANDQVGDCVIAGAMHETLLWNAIAGRRTVFTDQNALETYSAITGYNPKDPSSDQGTDMRAAAQYRQDNGINDNSGLNHKIGAYVLVDPKNIDEVLEACWLFGAIGLGITLPQSAMTQFEQGQPWTVPSMFDWKGKQILGGHYVPLVADRATPVIVTWGKVQPVTTQFLSHYGMAALAYVSQEALTNGKSSEGFDYATLNQDLIQLQAL